MSTLDARKNFAIVTAITGYDDAAVTITLVSGDGEKLPQPSTDGAFNLTWWNATGYNSPADDPDVEIVRCTARTGDVITIVRAQEGTTATVKSISEQTYKLHLGPTAKTITDIETVLDSKEDSANKGIANGYASLDGDGLVPVAQLPEITITDTFVVSSQIEMLALTAQTGDVAVRTDENKTYILRGTDPSVLADWELLRTPTDSVLSVNGMTGSVEVTLASIAAYSGTTAKSLYQMTSTIPVEFRSSDGNTLLYLDETNERIGIGTNAPSDSLSLSGNSATRIGTTWLNTNSSPATSAFLGAYSGNMQMGTVSNHPFYLETNNTVRISIAAAGNIGIGLNSGSAKLHVLATTEQLRLGYDVTNYASFTVTSGGLLNIAPTGTNVGINVASPSSPLHVDGAIRSQRTGTATQNIVLDGGDSSAIYLTGSSTTGGQKILRFRNLVTGGAATDATNQFGWDLNTDSSILQIATLSFGSGFKVNRSNTTTQFLSVNGGDSSGIYLTGQSNTSAEKILYISNFTNGTATSANGMRFRVGDVGTPVTAGVINYLGNWGFGLTSPTHKLDAYISSSSTGVSTIYGLRDIPSGTISSGSSINGIFGQVTVSGSSTISNVIPTAGRFIAEHDGSSTVGGVYGVYAHARTNAASTGVLANAYSLYAVAPNNNQAGNTITNAYSLYIESPTAGTALNYGLFQTGTAINQFGGNVGIGISPTAVLHLKAGTATASTAPLKFTSGTNLTTAEAGAMEYNGTSLFFTRTGTTREIVNTTVTKTDTGDGTGAEGLFQINTFDNTLKIYAEGAWRTLATW